MRTNKNQLTVFSSGRLFVSTILFFLLNITCLAQPLASGKNKFVGNIIGAGGFRTDFTKYWNQVTAENAGKWGSANPSVGTYNWGQLDNIYNYAVTNNFPYKHHALIWGSQYPSFVSTLDSASLYQEIENWIKNSGQRYTKADMVDVVNEPLHSFTGSALNIIKALGGNGSTGWDWVIKTFQLARKYWSPATKLLINEYSVINDGNAANNYISLINILKSLGLVDGIGIQAHNFEVNGGASVSTLKTNLDKIAATGLPIYITEFDISVQDDNTQLAKYQSIFPLLYEHPSVKGITLWGYVINQIWQADGYLINERNGERPALQWLRTYLAAPYRPLLISPNSTANESLTPKLTWRSSSGASSYHVQVSMINSFSSIVVDTTISDTLITLKPLSSNSRYFWRVSSISSKGESPFTDPFYFITKDAVSVKDADGLPSEFKLYQNYPNPFNPETTIEFTVPVESSVRISVYDVMGRVVQEIARGEYSPGRYKVNFNGSKLASGIYYYRLESGSFADVKKLILLK